MKKLFSMAVIFIMALTLAGCSTTKIGDLESEIEELNQEIWDTQSEMGDYVIDNTMLEDELSDTRQALVQLEEEMLLLLDELSVLQSQIYDNVITFSLTNEQGSFSSKTVGYNDDFEGTLFDLLNQNLDVGYSDSEYGKYIYSLEDLSPKTGAYISFSKNGVPSMTGVELSTFEDGDIFSFEVIWWDTFQENVDDVIQLFIENHASNYVNSESVDYNVLLGLNLLGIENDFVSKNDVELLINNSTLVYVQDYFKAIMMLNSVDSDVSALIQELNVIVTPGPYGQTAYGLLALDSVESTEDYSAFVTDALADLETTTPYDLGLDAGGISLVALSNYTDVDDLLAEYITWINNSQLDSGGVMTRETTWGETTYPGTENASSISQVILGLLAQGVDPTGSLFSKTEGNLVSRLLEFSTDTGSFDYVFGDELTEDLYFSTPQAFLALVSYQVYVNTQNPVNPYDFK